MSMRVALVILGDFHSFVTPGGGSEMVDMDMEGFWVNTLIGCRLHLATVDPHTEVLAYCIDIEIRM